MSSVSSAIRRIFLVISVPYTPQIHDPNDKADVSAVRRYLILDDPSARNWEPSTLELVKRAWAIEVNPIARKILGLESSGVSRGGLKKWVDGGNVPMPKKHRGYLQTPLMGENQTAVP